MFCGECGAKVLDGYEFCMKCGTKIEINTNEQDNKRKPLGKKRKNIRLIVIGMIFLCIIVASFYFINLSREKSGLYNNIKWGLSIEEIKEKIDGEIIDIKDRESIKCSIADYEGMKDINALVVYDFENDILVKISIMLMTGDENKQTDEIIIDRYTNKFNKLYGESKKGILGNNWESEKSLINVSYIIEGLVVLEYKDITKIDE